METRLQPSTSLGELLARVPRGEAVAVVRDGDRTIVGLGPQRTVVAEGDRCFEVLDELRDGWWAGFLSYDLGRAVERVPALAPRSHAVPDLCLVRFTTQVVFGSDGSVRAEGDPAPFERTLRHDPVPSRAPSPAAWRSSLEETAYRDAVRSIIDHLAAGDCYQVNLTRQLSCDEAADPVTLFRGLRAGNPAPHEALVVTDSLAVVSASPERFLRREGRAVETRPIKGTGTDAGALRRSEKDRAENVMIADLARNDLGRVCEYGSVHVPALCDVERHPGLVHLVTTVRGTLRPDVSNGDLVRATFPPASVTGCPKPRVLEIIETLEPVRRGVYCGAVGFLDADRDVLDLNVAIRTFTVAEGRTFFGVGGGIVADSEPEAEWAETELKARRLLALAAGERA